MRQKKGHTLSKKAKIKQNPKARPLSYYETKKRPYPKKKSKNKAKYQNPDPDPKAGYKKVKNFRNLRLYITKPETLKPKPP